MNTAKIAPSILLTALFLGCAGSTPPADTVGGKTNPKPTTTATEATAEGTEPASTEEAEPSAPTGPEFSVLRTAALACTVDEAGDFDRECEGYTNWSSDQPAFADGKANKQLLGMLASKDVKERILAAEMLRVTLTDDLIDAASADTVLNAVEKEREETLTKTMAMLAGHLAIAKVKKLDRAIAIAKAHPLPDYAKEFVFYVGDFNADPKLVPYALEKSKDKSDSVRNAALQLLIKLVPVDAAVSCKAINELRDDKDDFVKNRAIDGLSVAGCAAYTDKLLDSLAAVDVKKNVNQAVGYALRNICERSNLTPVQRDRASKAARRITDAKTVHSNTRFYTIAAVLKCDGEKGKEYVAKFKDDPDATMAGRARELLK